MAKAPTSQILKNLSQFQITETDLEHIRYIGTLLLEHLPDMMDSFYNSWMSVQTYYKSYFYNQDMVDHLKSKQIEYWQAFFKAEIDESYIKSRERLGQIHAQLGLSKTYYYQAMAQMQWQFQRTLATKEEVSKEMIWSFQRYFLWDMAIVSKAATSTSTQMLERMLSKQNEEIAELNAPITKLWDDILFLPLQGRIGKNRGAKISKDILQKVGETGAEVMLIDIGGLSQVNKKVAKLLLRIIKTTKLMGCKIFLSGISPAFAQTFTEMDVKLSEINTTGAMMDAMLLALKATGRQVVSIEEKWEER